MQLVLYYRKRCPFCRKVLSALEGMNLQVPMKELSEDPAYPEELQSIGGKTQVPCLVQIDAEGKKSALYESDDIIDWFKAKNSPL